MGKTPLQSCLFRSFHKTFPLQFAIPIPSLPNPTSSSTLKRSTMMNNSALSHLVEAASALSELVDAKGPPMKHQNQITVATLRQVNQPITLHPKPPPQTNNKKPIKRDIFPKQLMDILSDASLSDVISWLPHGRSFVIIRPDIFTETVLPKFLPPVDSRTSTKYPSFTRKLNRWGFRQATKGPDTGAFHHNLFRRDQPELCLQMVCQKNKDRQQRQRRSLPPKKRAVADSPKKGEVTPQPLRTNSPEQDTSSRTTPETPACQQNSSTHHAFLAPPATVSADERSQGSSMSRSSSGSLPVYNDSSAPSTPSTVMVSAVKPEASSPALIPYISNDQSFVQRTLRQRNQAEVIRAAKAMLYESYMKALVSKGGADVAK